MKIQLKKIDFSLLLLAVVIFLLTFALSFYLFGGFKKVSDHKRAKEVVKINIQEHPELFINDEVSVEDENDNQENKVNETNELSNEEESSNDQNSDSEVVVEVDEKAEENTEDNASPEEENDEAVVDSKDEEVETKSEVPTNEEINTNQTEEVTNSDETEAKDEVASEELKEEETEVSDESIEEKPEMEKIDKIFSGETDTQEAQNLIEQSIEKYTIKSGDTWGKIAKSYNLSVEDLQALNGGEGKPLHPGNELIVPKSQ